MLLYFAEYSLELYLRKTWNETFIVCDGSFDAVFLRL